MTDKQRFLVYVHLGRILGEVMRQNGLSMTEALREMSNSQFIEKLEDLETGYYLESSAYLYEEYQKLALTPV
jgi:hypothetical protein